MKTFLICPVRSHSAIETQSVVSDLELAGWCVHWPHRDTDQVDPTGLQICHDNLLAIEAADVIHVIWDGKSQGCLFDLGMAFALRKPVRVIFLPNVEDGVKSFQAMITAWASK